MTVLPVPVPVPLPPHALPGLYAPIHASILTLSYVGGFYLSPTVRKLPKDDPRVMKSRLRVASIVTALGTVATGLVLWRAADSVQSLHWTLRFPQTLLMLGLPAPLTVPTFLTSSILPLKPGLLDFLRTHLLPAVTIPLALTASLFAGPLYVEWLDDALPVPSFNRCFVRNRVQSKDEDNASKHPPTWRLSLSAIGKELRRAGNKVRTWVSGWWGLHGLRNFVLGPLTEEYIWRSCILSMSYFSGSRKAWLIFGTPLWFGVAHLHHAWETYKSRGRTKQALQFATLQSTLQFAYTTVFGWYANFLFLRTGSIVAPFLSHVFCNIMGLPNPAAAAQAFPQHKKGIYASHLLGIAIFSYALMPLTQPSLYGGSVFWP